MCIFYRRILSWLIVFFFETSASGLPGSTCILFYIYNIHGCFWIDLGCLSSSAPLKAYYTPRLGLQILGAGLLSRGKRSFMAETLPLRRKRKLLHYRAVFDEKACVSEKRRFCLDDRAGTPVFLANHEVVEPLSQVGFTARNQCLRGWI